VLLASLLRALLNLLKLPFVPLWWALRLLGRPRTPWIEVRIRRRLVELVGRRPSALARLAPWLAGARPTALEDLRRLAAHAARDRRVEGVVFVVPMLAVGWATARSLRDVLGGLRKAGKRVAVFLPDGGTHKELYVASAADTILMPPQATLSMLGVAARSRYFKGLLDKAGVRVERFARAEFKTAGENLARDRMSGPQRTQLGALLDAIDGELRGALGAGRGLDAGAVEALFEEGFLRGPAAIARGVVDVLAYEDEIAAALQPGVARPRLGQGDAYLRFREARWFHPLRREPYVAVVPVHGPIGVGRRADRVVAALRVARKDPGVRGVILHVNSPGGSATVSDRVYREVARVSEKKPVVACFGDVAASGGYYVAAGAAAIVAQPTTVTGSIGVVSARLVATELLERLGVRTEVLRRAPHADMFSPSRPLDDDERAILKREMDGFYRDFVALVARGRGRSVDEVEALARGRIWAGVDAQREGLVDRLGGLETAMEELRVRLGGARLRPRLLLPRSTDIRPEPSEPALAFFGALAPGAIALWELARGSDRVLLLDPTVPDFP